MSTSSTKKVVRAKVEAITQEHVILSYQSEYSSLRVEDCYLISNGTSLVNRNVPGWWEITPSSLERIKKYVTTLA